MKLVYVTYITSSSEIKDDLTDYKVKQTKQVYLSNAGNKKR